MEGVPCEELADAPQPPQAEKVEVPEPGAPAADQPVDDVERDRRRHVHGEPGPRQAPRGDLPAVVDKEVGGPVEVGDREGGGDVDGEEGVGDQVRDEERRGGGPLEGQLERRRPRRVQHQHDQEPVPPPGSRETERPGQQRVPTRQLVLRGSRRPRARAGRIITRDVYL